ncbi:hypothetical protein ACFVZZ_14605 [Streptomyces chartreusis]|uniref:hypothetical protein n=1 Tax=Streptomyces chartreusis TaxID=1969 RepID=UPI0036DD40D4
MSRGSGDDLTFGQKVVGGLIGAISNTHSVGHYHQTVGGAAPADAQTTELLAAVRELRADLQRLVQNPETAALDGELASTEEEITSTGQVSPTRLQRLRHALQDAGSVVAVLSSGATVAAMLGL